MGENNFHRRNDEAYEMRLLSPAKMEKLYKSKGLELDTRYVDKVSSGTTIAPEADPRPEAITLQALAAAAARATT